MVKKSDSDWSNFAIQQTSTASIKKYLQLCEHWLVTPHEKLQFHQDSFCNKKIEFSYVQEAHLGMYEIEMRNTTHFNCNICKSPSNMLQDGKSIVANPFTRAQYMLLCNSCYHELSSFR